MISPLDTYLGWDELEHFAGCKRPEWKIGTRTEEDFRHVPYGFRDETLPAKHACPNEECDHSSKFEKTTTRIVCFSCGVVHLISGEDTRTRMTNTRDIGYGLTPRTVAGLLLWPGQPWLDFGRLSSDEPHDFVVTRAKVKEVTAEDVIGQVVLGTGARRGFVWTALATADPKGQYGYGGPVRFLHANDGRGRGGKPLRTVTAAARWVGARLAEAQTESGAA
ncbi:hypothetical protein ACFYRN_16515 [Streptomyces sp. NPDC005227]|uniref:hypothetical protein n=1 Tax=Streptomyces sp. NPDC005227 TaxID=3364707 RepID=UPI0036A91558